MRQTLRLTMRHSLIHQFGVSVETLIGGFSEAKVGGGGGLFLYTRVFLSTVSLCCLLFKRYLACYVSLYALITVVVKSALYVAL